MSQESLGLSGKILSTSPRSSDLDENEISHLQQQPPVLTQQRGLTRSPFAPFVNKSNIKEVTAQVHHAMSPQPSKQGLELMLQGSATGEELENHHSAVVLSPRQNLLASSSSKVLSVQKTREMEDRKKRILANKDQLQKHVELLNRAKQNIVR